MIQLTIKPAQKEHLELLAALFSDLLQEGIQVDDTELHVYPTADEWQDRQNRSTIQSWQEQFNFTCLEKEMPDVNWNKAWESNYESVIIDDILTIHAPFHDSLSDANPKLIIQPQMSFGTGHHATTYCMIKTLSLLNLEGKSVMDAGTGTGVLAIYTVMRGADRVLAFDIDEACVRNTHENIVLNPLVEGLERRLKVEHARLNEIEACQFDIVIANINRNYLLEDAEDLVNRMKNGGLILLSGFYDGDVRLVADRYLECGTVAQYLMIKDQWACLVLLKPQY